MVRRKSNFFRRKNRRARRGQQWARHEFLEPRLL